MHIVPKYEFSTHEFASQDSRLQLGIKAKEVGRGALNCYVFDSADGAENRLFLIAKPIEPIQRGSVGNLLHRLMDAANQVDPVHESEFLQQFDAVQHAERYANAKGYAAGYSYAGKVRPVQSGYGLVIVPPLNVPRKR